MLRTHTQAGADKMVKTGDTVLHEDLGALVLVMTYDNGCEVVVGVASETEAKQAYKDAKKYDTRIVSAYTATRKV